MDDSRTPRRPPCQMIRDWLGLALAPFGAAAYRQQSYDPLSVIETIL
jgi:hypothetical protein